MPTPNSEQSIFLAALELTTLAERNAYLKGVCTGNPELLANVQALLAAHVQSDNFLERPPVEGTVSHRTLMVGLGTMIGPYKLREQIGEGGFGVVYVAEQEKPVRRKVALKIIKPGMDTKDVIARFEAERQALALMDHPNVARVLDAGATDSGCPFFVMELVHGVPITEFCDKNKLPTRQRLLLFADICRAVQHAHQKGIIHRDLKPSNIMVTLHDGKPVAKVIDFGVSKALSQQLTEKSIYTAYGQMIGTPSYMSPEQAEMSGLGIDTRSDIYSLGVLLYELLTGKTPLDAKRLREGGYDAMLRMIRDEEPPLPSLKISTLGEEATTIAQHRHTDPAQLRRSLRGELDWIVMKCLEKDRSRRYETAIGLARDVERYLQDEPVEARLPSTTYRLRKLARKYRGAVTAFAAVGGALLIGAIVATWQAIEATAERNRAEHLSQQLTATLAQLHSQLIERALLHAVLGDVAEVERSISHAERAGVPRDWILTLQGVAHLHNGDNPRAIELLEEAINANDANVSAKSLVSMAYFHIGAENRWSQHATFLENARPRPEWEDFDTFFLGYAYFYTNDHYRRAADSFDIIVKKHPTWIFARAMRASAWAHQAWYEGSAQRAAEAYNEMAIVTPFLPDTLFALAHRIFVCTVALQRSADVDDSRLRELADDAAYKLAQHPRYIVGTSCRIYYHEAAGRPDLAAAARDEIWRYGAGFFLYDFFHELFGSGQDQRILELNKRGPEPEAMKAIVHAWHKRKDDALRICETLDTQYKTWPIRREILIAYLLCSENKLAEKKCQEWLSASAGTAESVQPDRKMIEFVANGAVEADLRLESMPAPLRPQFEVLLGVIALSKSDPARAGEIFERSLAGGDARFMTSLARAFLQRLRRDVSLDDAMPKNR